MLTKLTNIIVFMILSITTIQAQVITRDTLDLDSLTTYVIPDTGKIFTIPSRYLASFSSSFEKENYLSICDSLKHELLDNTFDNQIKIKEAILNKAISVMDKVILNSIALPFLELKQTNILEGYCVNTFESNGTHYIYKWIYNEPNLSDIIDKLLKNIK